MPIYKCDKCNKIFTRKSGYASHIARIKSCIKDANINNQCIYCSKSYSTRFNLNAHIKICKEKPIIDETQFQINELKKMFEEQVKHNKELEKKIDQLSKEKNNINITENSHNTTTNNNIINIYNIGKEDLSLLAKEDIIKICTSGTYYPLVTANILHCNEKYPEFQNILISNLRSNTGLVKINDNWVSKSHDEIFRTLLKVDKNHISSLMKDLKVDEKLKVKLESTKDEINTDESKEHQIPKIKECLYNASKMITKNKKKKN